MKLVIELLLIVPSHISPRIRSHTVAITNILTFTVAGAALDLHQLPIFTHWKKWAYSMAAVTCCQASKKGIWILYRLWVKAAAG